MTMSLAMTYTLLPDYSTRNDLVLQRPHTSMDTNAGLRSGYNKDLVAGGRPAYKYYILSDSDNTIYNRMKNTEKMIFSTIGSYIDVFA